jgi:hypothetical protein
MILYTLVIMDLKLRRWIFISRSLEDGGSMFLRNVGAHIPEYLRTEVSYNSEENKRKCDTM